MQTLHSAPIVLPVSTDPIGDGAVLVDGDRVQAVGPRAELVKAHPGVRERAWSGVLTPGLVNAHAHLQYTDFEELNSLDQPFHVWIGRMIEKRATFTDAMWGESTRRGLHLMLRSGITSVADIVTDPAGVLPPTARSGIGGVSYIEIVFEDARSWSDSGRARLLERLASGPASRTLGISPHTPYTVATAVFADCVAIARDKGLRLHPHVAEAPAESEYVLTGTGPFAESMTKAGKAMELIRDGGSGLSPVQFLDKLGVFGPDMHAAHCVHCDPADRHVLRERGVYAALCARSNKILQSGRPPVADYLREDSPFGIGTDSLASSPSLDLLEEAAALRALAVTQGYTEADLDRRIFEAATLGGAGAMGLTDVGRLEPGSRADLAVFALPDLASVTPATAYGALLDAASTGAHRCLGTILGGTIVHRG
ncbi:amidohydrolase family protein [Actinospica sp. MGRD01-02]|uniref:Amidohydrolase family protein n=1 Tax=Actinospica acidithermotolerans TaxID=2828514 RepID=A0A941EBJ5_9ACTN|nr:amidohydrolase family protein [Actinospica acidithermotolerans]MBR7827433.1 amidohydrolase family protein [Actinospica acidithermotolerans]